MESEREWVGEREAVCVREKEKERKRETFVRSCVSVVHSGPKCDQLASLILETTTRFDFKPQKSSSRRARENYGRVFCRVMFSEAEKSFAAYLEISVAYNQLPQLEMVELSHHWQILSCLSR